MRNLVKLLTALLLSSSLFASVPSIAFSTKQTIDAKLFAALKNMQQSSNNHSASFSPYGGKDISRVRLTSNQQEQIYQPVAIG